MIQPTQSASSEFNTYSPPPSFSMISEDSSTSSASFIGHDAISVKIKNNDPMFALGIAKSASSQNLKFPHAKSVLHNDAILTPPPEINVVDTLNMEPITVELDLTDHEKSILRETWQYLMDDTYVNDVGSAAAGSTGAKVIKHPKRPDMIRITMNNASSGIASTIFCRQFYGTLLSTAPYLEEMFPSIRHQAVAFAGVLATAITQLDHIDILADYLTSLAKRHSRILNIEPVHFDLMGQAFIQTLSDRFQHDFTLELEDAWVKLYSYLANKLLQDGIDPIVPHLLYKMPSQTSLNDSSSESDIKSNTLDRVSTVLSSPEKLNSTSSRASLHGGNKGSQSKKSLTRLISNYKSSARSSTRFSRFSRNSKTFDTDANTTDPASGELLIRTLSVESERSDQDSIISSATQNSRNHLSKFKMRPSMPRLDEEFKTNYNPSRAYGSSMIRTNHAQDGECVIA